MNYFPLKCIYLKKLIYLVLICFKENACKSYPGQTCVKIQDCPTAYNIISSNRAVSCGLDSSGEVDSMCCPIRDFVQNLPTTSVIVSLCIKQVLSNRVKFYT